MLIPFAYNLRLGTDLVDCKRILNYVLPNISRTNRLVNRYLTFEERQALHKRFPRFREAESQSEKELRILSSFLAGRWAAKEAAKKAWGASLVSWQDLRVGVAAATHISTVICNPFHQSAGNPDVTEQEAILSISHDGDYAIATVLAQPLNSVILEKLQRDKLEADAKAGKTVIPRRLSINKKPRLDSTDAVEEQKPHHY